jgi:spermidine synthase
MSHIFLDRRDGRLALYLNGDLQFDARDERLYHEPLALVPVALAARRAPGRRLRVAILGGGDGLALRAVLRFPAVAEAHVVDRDPNVLRLGAGELAELNAGAFRDPRARIHTLDARDFLRRARGFDALICDLTYPRDVAGAGLCSVAFFHRARRALRPGGVLAVNAVSPERTPQAFGCMGATLAAAGLGAIPYAFLLPCFQEEGYGRWGFFYASARPLRREELRRLHFPAGAALTPDDLVAGTLLPEAAAAEALAASPNRTDELLYYLLNAAPVSWEGPGALRLVRFAPGGARPAVGTGPRITAGQGFARWLREEEGRRSLEGLLTCLPLWQRGEMRAALLEWSHQAEILFREVDLRAFVDQALRRARALPREWLGELHALRDRIRDGLPSLNDLLQQAYRVFAVYLLVLLLVNLFFPDNLYAKGFSGSSGFRSGSSRSSSGTSASSAFHGFSFSDPTQRTSPYRYHSYHSSGSHSYRSGASRTRVADAQGQEYPAQRFAFSDPQGERRPVSALLALNRELQVLESGGVVYAVPVAGYQFLLEPGRLRVQDRATGADRLALLPPATLEDEARKLIQAQGPLIASAIADHQRWLVWVDWASSLPGGRRASSEMEELTAIQQAVRAAGETWGQATTRVVADPGPKWFPIFPGVHLEALNPLAPAVRRVALVTPEGTILPRPVAPPADLTDEDRFVFQVLRRRLVEGRDQSLRETVDAWIAMHGEALGVKPGAVPPTGRRQ